MAIEPVYNNLQTSKITLNNKQFPFEFKFQLDDVDGEFAVVGANFNDINYSLIDGKLKVNGKYIFNCISGKWGVDLSCKEWGMENTYEINCEMQNVNVINVTASVCDISCRKSDNNVFIGGTIYMCVCLEVIDCFSYLDKSKDLLLKTEKYKVGNIRHCKQVQMEIDDDFTVNYCIGRIIGKDVKAQIEKAEIINDKLFVFGTLFLRLTVLQKNDNYDIVIEEKSVPFKKEIDFTDCTAEDFVNTCLGDVSISLKIIVDEEKSISNISIMADANMSVIICNNVDVDFSIDAYSPSNQLELHNVKKDICEYSPQQFFNYNESLKGEIKGEFSDGELYIFGVEFKEKCVKLQSDSVQCNVVGYMLNKKGTTYSCKQFTLQLNLNIAELPSCGVGYLNLKKFNYSFNEDIVLEVDFSLSTLPVRESCCEFLFDIGIGEEKTAETSPISVYIARMGEDMWQICKELNSTEELIMSQNPDLTFPLEANKKVVLYREG